MIIPVGANQFATYVVQTSTLAPPNAQVLASLATGLMYVTTTTGAVTSLGLGSGLSISGGNLVAAGGVTGSGTTGQITKWSSSSAIGNATAGTDFVAPGGVSGGQTIDGDTASAGAITINSTAHATKGSVNFNGGLAAFNADCSVLTTPNAFAIGGASHGSFGSYSIALGYAAISSNTATVSVGQSSQATGYQSVALGAGAVASGYGAIVVGSGTASQNFGIMVGYSCTAAYAGSIAIGTTAATTAANQCVIGGNNVNGFVNEFVVCANTTGLTFTGQVVSSTSVFRNAGRIKYTLPTGTDASRIGSIALYACDYSGTDRLGLQITSTGSVVQVGMFGATPVSQPTAGGVTSGFTANTGTPVLSGSTSTGNTGSSAYTLGDIVAALKGLGLIAP